VTPQNDGVVVPSNVDTPGLESRLALELAPALAFFLPHVGGYLPSSFSNSLLSAEEQGRRLVLDVNATTSWRKKRHFHSGGWASLYFQYAIADRRIF
jgi:hypothetical protein